MWNPKLGLKATHSLTCNLIHSWSSDASLPVLDYPLIRHAWAPLILIYPGKAFTNKERYAHEHHSYPCCSEQLQHCCTTEHHPQWNVWVVNALLKSILRTVFSGGVRVLQSTPLCNIFRSAWLISSSNMPLKHITFLPPPWLEKCTSHGSLCSLLLRVTVQCSRRKHTCTSWFCVCVCVYLWKETRTSYLHLYYLACWCLMLFWLSPHFLYDETTLFFSGLHFTVSTFVFTTLTLTAWNKKATPWYSLLQNLSFLSKMYSHSSKWCCEFPGINLILAFAFNEVKNFDQVAHWSLWMLVLI